LGRLLCFLLIHIFVGHKPIAFLRVGLLSNKLIVVGIAFMVILQLLFTYLPLMNRLFHTVPIGYDSWLRIMAVGLISHWAVSFEKWLTRRAAD
jgi:magnesium-transporting ATPase (P-type)